MIRSFRLSWFCLVLFTCLCSRRSDGTNQACLYRPDFLRHRLSGRGDIPVSILSGHDDISSRVDSCLRLRRDVFTRDSFFDVAVCIVSSLSTCLDRFDLPALTTQPGTTRAVFGSQRHVLSPPARAVLFDKPPRDKPRRFASVRLSSSDQYVFLRLAISELRCVPRQTLPGRLLSFR